MFRLTSSNLALNSKPNQLAPLFTIWQQDEQGTAPILRINCYSEWLNETGWELENILLGIPDIGSYYRLLLDSRLVVERIFGWRQIVNALEARAETFWQADKIIYLYQQNVELPNFIIATFHTNSPGQIAGNYIVELPIGFTATIIISEGLVFNSGTGIGNFAQNNNIVTIYGNSAYSMEFGQELLIEGELITSSFEKTSTIASFYLEEVIYLDKIEWAGHNFSVAKTATSPKLWEFTWNRETKIANLFIDFNCIPYFEPEQINVITKSSGIINFNR